MNRDSVNEYISWLKEFGEIYKDYIDSSEELREIFTGTLEKFQKVLRGNNKNSTEKDIIKLLKNLVEKFSVVYDANETRVKSKKGPRNTNAFKQDIYERKIAELKEELIANINDPKLFLNFENIVMSIAKKRQMIEFLKLGNFEIYGKRRARRDYLKSLLKFSHAEHLFKELSNKGIDEKFIKYTNKGKEIPLTFYLQMGTAPEWHHTNARSHPELFKIMNDLYTEFLSLVNRRNNASKRDILPELYWLYMQTCPFERGSAAIGEILFSVLLRKHFGCDFLISNGWNGDPLTIPDIHALHYQLDEFKKIFWDQFVNCTEKPINNINNLTANQLRAKVIGP
jgi:hypothetical protein